MVGALLPITFLILRLGVLETHESCPDDCCLRATHWDLIRWFFERISYIEVTEISDNNVRNLDFADTVMHELWQKSTTFLNSYPVDYTIPKQDQTDFDDDPVPLQIFNATVVNSKKRMRRDENRLGAFIYADSLMHLKNYVQKSRFPKSDGNFVLIVNKPVLEDYITLASQVMAILWRKYRIMYAFLILTCPNTEALGYYDPFEKDALSGKWGAMKWTTIDKVSYENGWIFSVADNFRGYPFNTGLFVRYPTLVPIVDLPPIFLQSYYASGLKYSSGYGGIDGMLVGNLAEALNFYSITIITDRYGDKLANNTFGGGIGDVISQKIDAAMNSRFIVDYDTVDIDFLYPVFSDKYCVIAPGALKVPQWQAIFHIFDTQVWILILAVDVVCAFIWYSLINLRGHIKRDVKFSKRPHERLGDITMSTFNVMTAYPTRMPIESLERIFVASCLMSNLIIVGTFQGSLTKSFSTPLYEKDIDTLHDLDKSNLPIVASTSALKNLLGKTDTPLIRSLRLKSHPNVNKNVSTIERAAFNRNICGVERYSDVNLIIQTKYVRSDGTTLVHIVKECPSTYHLGFIVKKGSPYQPLFNRVLLQFFESGLLPKWNEQIERALIVYNKIKLEPLRSLYAFSLVDMQTAFLVLGLGLTLSTIVFAAEVLHSCSGRDLWNSIKVAPYGN